MRNVLIGAAFAVGCICGCSVFLNFDPNQQPCDSKGQCLAGYSCVGGVCVQGADAGSPCGACPAADRCLSSTRQCVPNTCQNKHCPIGTGCAMADGGPACTPISYGVLGGPCQAATDCDGGALCYASAIREPDGGGRPGVCLLPCVSDAGCPLGASCESFSIAVDGGGNSLCVPPGAVSPCSVDAPCQDDGLVCTVYDDPVGGPITVCDQPAPAPGQPCASDAGQVLCRNGLCEAPPGHVGFCGELCQPGSCGPLATCALVNFTEAGGAINRLIPMCVPNVTFCAPCSGTSCGFDAPVCDVTSSTPRCHLACATATPGFAQCPDGQSCQNFGGTNVCSSNVCSP